MGQKIYKYFASELIDIVFAQEEFCGVKCSYPQEYNDPYELFLGVDTTVDAEELATYKEIIEDVPQFLTSCFSQSPVVPPMWAHYARNQTGFVLEFDVDNLKSNFEGIYLKEITYRTEPDPSLKDRMIMAARRKKGRDAIFLSQAVSHLAYFSKFNEWSYEQEIRLVNIDDHIEKNDENKILNIPLDCVSAIIVGNRCSEEIITRSQEIAFLNNFDWYKLNIGKSYTRPYLKCKKDDVFVYENNKISEPVSSCFECSEPMINNAELCPWCSITDEHRLQAAHANPLRIFDRYGILDDYLEGVEKIERNRKS
jgi:hypothetical protein